MKPVIIDTDVAFFVFKNDSRAQSYLPYLHDGQWLISFMTEAEMSLHDSKNHSLSSFFSSS